MITLGSIEVDLTEPEWIPEKGSGLVPGDVVLKDPTAVNTGKNDAWIFLEVQIPVKKISLVDPVTRKKQEARETELFSFTAKDSWELIEKTSGETNRCYVYGYCSAVSPGEKTEPLFEQVTLANYLEGEMDESEKLTMPIEAMAIQTNVCPQGADLKEVYQQYLAQEKADSKEESDIEI